MMHKLTAGEMFAAIRDNDLSKLPTIKAQGDEWVDFKYQCTGHYMTISAKRLFTPINSNSHSLKCYTALYIAIEYDRFEFVKALLEHGAKQNVNILTPNNDTPLCRAIKNKNEKIAKELINADANLSFQDFDGNNYLHLAARNNLASLVSFLLKTGNFDIEAPNNSGKTAAAEASDPSIEQTIQTILHYRQTPYYFNSLSLLRKSQENISAEEVAKTHPVNKATIVWAHPMCEAEKDAFIYLSRTEEKIVHIPFTAIHTHLMEANWLMRGTDARRENYITARILFIVSADPYPKTPATGAKPKYQGRRTFIDFPIVTPITVLNFINRKSEPFADQEEYEAYIKAEHVKLGKYEDNLEKGTHSEQSLFGFIRQKEFIKSLVATLKSHLPIEITQDSPVKLYSCQLFLHSINSICNTPEDNCEGRLSDLMTSHEEGSFLFLLKKSLEDVGFTLPNRKNKGFPRMLINVSSSLPFYTRCSSRLSEDIIKVFADDASKPSIYIDSKILSDNVILSTTGKWIDGQNIATRFQQVQTALTSDPISVKIPFYTGFKSAGGNSDNLHTQRSKMRASLPQSFDGKSIFTIRSEQNG